MTPLSTKPRLLIIELWGLGDLAIATPFLRTAVHKYDITILAKPYAEDLQARLWPEIKVLPFVAPWTAFRGKYHLYAWPWRQMLRLGREIRSARFDVGLSARWDPRDHFLLAFAGAKRRLGFPRVGSRIFLTEPLVRADPEAHRYENWRILGRALGLELPARETLTIPRSTEGQFGEILVHTGAGQPIRVWPLENYRKLVARLRQKQYRVQVACDPGQRSWWLQNGETGVATPKTVAELQALVDRATLVIGNDSGPGHLASFAGVPTFTIFGPQLPEWFAPLHPTAQWVEGKACPYKPCSDYCRFPEPICLTGWTEPDIWTHIEPFVKKASNGR
jgi:ADP-heptose:LPS heptosyltransferase